jgi:hypothetical protein
VSIKIQFQRPQIDEKTNRPAVDERNDPKDYEKLGTQYEPQMFDRLAVHVSNRRERGTVIRAVTDLANALGIEYEIVTDDDTLGSMGESQDALLARVHQHDSKTPRVERSDDDRRPMVGERRLNATETTPDLAPRPPEGDVIINDDAKSNVDSSRETAAIPNQDALKVGESPNKGPLPEPK